MLENPRSIELLLANAKRFIGRPEDRIQLEEVIAREIGFLVTVLNTEEFDTTGAWSDARFVRTVGRYEAVSEPSARLTAAPGGPGTRSGGTTTAPQGACWTGTVPRVSDGPRRDKPMRRTGAADREETGTETRKRGPGEQKSPRWSAERRRARRSGRGPPKPARAKAGGSVVAPFGAPPPRTLCGGQKRQGQSPAPLRRGADDARLEIFHATNAATK